MLITSDALIEIEALCDDDALMEVTCEADTLVDADVDVHIEALSDVLIDALSEAEAASALVVGTGVGVTFSSQTLIAAISSSLAIL